MTDNINSSSSVSPEKQGEFPAEDYVAFHGDLLLIRNQIVDALNGIERSVVITKEEVKIRQVEGMPLIPLDVELPSMEVLLRAVSDFIEIAKKHKVLGENEALKISEVLNESAIRRLIAAFVDREPEKIKKLGDELTLKPDSLLFIGENIARAVLKYHAGPLKELFDSQIAVKNGDCPVCCSAPRLSIISEEKGVRSLMCGMCETTWEYKRMGCPHCANEDQKKLRHFTVRSEPNYQVNVCDSCKRYLKQVDLRKLRGEHVASVDLDVAGARLDLLAWREGYR